MPAFGVDRVTSWGGHQVTVWLSDAATGATQTAHGEQYVVQLDLVSAPDLIVALVRAYQEAAQGALVDVAAGGCRTCGGSRKVGPDGRPYLGLFGGEWKPCPACVPRAERRIRDRVLLLRRRTRNQ